MQLVWTGFLLTLIAPYALVNANSITFSEIIDKPPTAKDDHIISRKVMKKIRIMAKSMCMWILIFVLFGEYLIPESQEKWQYERTGCCVYPGRDYDWKGEL